MLARSLLSEKNKTTRRLCLSLEPQGARGQTPSRVVVCCLLQGKKPQADRGVFTLQSRRRRPGPTQPNPTEASGMGKPSDLFLGDVVSSLLLSLTQLRSFFWGGRNSVMTQTQINGCSGSEPPLTRLTQHKRSVFANRASVSAALAQHKVIFRR